MRNCECGNEVTYDGCTSLDLEDNFLVIKGEAECHICNKKYNYTDLHVINYKEPYDVELEEINE